MNSLPRLPSSRSTFLRNAWKLTSYATIFFTADLFLNRFAFNDGWTILWPLNGVILAILIMLPRSAWPLVLLGIELGIGIGECLADNTIGQAFVQRLISLVEVLTSALLLPAFTNLEDWLRKPRIFLRFLAALVVGPTLSGILAALFFHALQGKSYLTAFDGWAAADGLGIAATMPLVLALRTQEMRGLFRRTTILRTFIVLSLALVTAAIVFSVSRYPLLFLLYPALLLVHSLLDFAGSALAAAAISILAVCLTTHGLGPFAVWPANLPVPRDVALQAYLGFHLVALFPASVMSMERKRMAAEVRATNTQLLMLASLDGLTGIPNRRALEERFAQEWSGSVRNQTPLAFIMIDIDHFKQFNDLYGHHAGDKCLQTVAATLARELHRVQDCVARFGGEEFALLLPHTDLTGAHYVAEAIRRAVLSLAIPHAGCSAGQITISLGCAALTPMIGESRVSLLQMADAALYEAKRTGRDRAVCFAGSPPAV